MKTATWYHASLKPIGRSSGRSAVACVAYRTGTTMTDERYAAIRDFSHKSDVVTSFTLAPEGSPSWAFDAEQLWNAAEAKEKRIDAQVSFEWEVALPNELKPAEREAIAHEFGHWLVDEYGVAVTIGIHEGGNRGNGKNDHMHAMITTRPIGPDGWAKNKLRDFNTRPGKENPEVTHVRKEIADIINGALESADSDTRVDYRSFKERGIDDEPTLHLGPAASALERAGRDGGDRAAINREIIEERLSWQVEQEAPEVTPDLDEDFSQRWGDDWQPLKRGADWLAEAEAPPLERSVDSSAMADAAPLERGTPAATAEEHTGWRRFVDRVRASAAEFWRDESSGVPEGQRGIAARLFDAGWRLFVGIREGEGVELAEGVQQSAELAMDLTEGKSASKPESTSGESGEPPPREPPRSFAERVRASAAAMLHNERGMVPDDPGDPFERLAAEWAQAPPADEGLPASNTPEPYTPEPEGPDIE